MEVHDLLAIDGIDVAGHAEHMMGLGIARGAQGEQENGAVAGGAQHEPRQVNGEAGDVEVGGAGAHGLFDGQCRG